VDPTGGSSLALCHATKSAVAHGATRLVSGEAGPAVQFGFPVFPVSFCPISVTRGRRAAGEEICFFLIIFSQNKFYFWVHISYWEPFSLRIFSFVQQPFFLECFILYLEQFLFLMEYFYLGKIQFTTFNCDKSLIFNL
jgi:hypothetical protein